MARLARKRHLKHGSFARTERSKHLRAFLAERADTLEETGASFNFTSTGGTVPAVPPVAATGVLTGTTIEADDTVTIGEVTYTFVAELTDNPAPVPYEVLVGASDSDSLDNLINAINAGEGAGTAYSVGTLVHPDVTAEPGDGDTMEVTAKVAGVAGNEVATTAELTAGDWADETLVDGADEVPEVPATGILTSAAHGKVVGEGPFVASSSGTLPTGLQAGQLYWIHSVPSSSTFTLTTRKGELGKVVPTNAGTGTLTLTKADSESAFYAYLKQNAPEVVRDADDVDDL